MYSTVFIENRRSWLSLKQDDAYNQYVIGFIDSYCVGDLNK